LQAITRIYGQLAAGKVVRVCAIVRDLCEAAFLCGICAVRRPSKPPRICAQFGSGSVLPKKVGFPSWVSSPFSPGRIWISTHVGISGDLAEFFLSRTTVYKTKEDVSQSFEKIAF
jgi:hypothetical protein